MIQFDGNILDVRAGIICHIADNDGNMPEKVSNSIKEKWPIVKSEYLSTYIDHDLKLGEVIFTNVDPNNFNLQVATMICKDKSYYTKMDYQALMDYQAFRKCIRKVSIWSETCANGTLPVYIPFDIVCKANWRIISNIIEKRIPKVIVIKEDRS